MTTTKYFETGMTSSTIDDMINAYIVEHKIKDEDIIRIEHGSKKYWYGSESTALLSYKNVNADAHNTQEADPNSSVKENDITGIGIALMLSILIAAFYCILFKLGVI